MLSRIPDYMINDCGAVVEWMDESVVIATVAFIVIRNIAIGRKENEI